MIKENLKQEYSAPALDVLWLEMEQGIAAGFCKSCPSK